MKYPYLQERGRFAPIVPIRLKGKDGWLTVDAYVDSGATYSTFKSEIAEILGIDLDKAEKVYATVGSGTLITVYLKEVDIEFAGKFFKVTLGFSKQLGIGFNVIGRKGFFENFSITFNEKERYIDFL